jgi:hypothetical protein
MPDDQPIGLDQERKRGYIKNEHHGMISPAMRRIIYLGSEFGTREADK